MALPGLMGTEHIGFTVPDLDEADDFFVGSSAATHVYSLGPFQHDDDWMREHLNVHPRTVMRKLRFYRCGTGANFEVFQYEPADGQAPSPATATSAATTSPSTSTIWMPRSTTCAPRASDPGRAHGQRNASEGQRWVYFLRPWGMQFELVSFPNGKAYEKNAEVLLWHPAIRRSEPDAIGGNGATQVRDGVTGARVADGLRDAILRGEYRPGKRMRQEDSPRSTAPAASRCAKRCGSWRPRGSSPRRQHRRLGLQAEPRRVRGALPGARADRAAAAAVQPAASDAGRRRPPGRAGRGDAQHHAMSRRSCAWTANSTWQLQRRRDHVLGEPSSGCGTPPSTIAAPSPGAGLEGDRIVHDEHHCWSPRSRARCRRGRAGAVRAHPAHPARSWRATPKSFNAPLTPQPTRRT